MKELLEAYYTGFAEKANWESAMRVKEMIIQGDRACVIGNYDLQFPNGNKLNGNVAELWTAKNGKLQSLRIYFDTATFANNTKR